MAIKRFNELPLNKERTAQAPRLGLKKKQKYFEDEGTLFENILSLIMPKIIQKGDSLGSFHSKNKSHSSNAFSIRIVSTYASVDASNHYDI